MKRFLALFLAVSISLQSFTAVGESSRLVGDSSVLNGQATEEGISSEESTGLSRENGEENREETVAQGDAEADSKVEASTTDAGTTEETGESRENLAAQSREANEQEGFSVKESAKEAESEETEGEKLPTLSYSTIERNEKKHFQYKDDEISVNAELEYPESLPKGVVFLVRPILEEERKEQYRAYKEALLEAKNEGKQDTENGESAGEEGFVLHDLRLYDVGFFLKEEKTGDWEEVQPEKGRVKIDFSLKDSLEGEGKLQVTHLPIKQEKKQEGINSLEIPNLQKEDILVEDLEVKENKAFFSKKERIQFSLDSFSTIGIYKGEVNATDHILNDVKFTLNNINVQLKNRGGQKDFQQVGKEGNTVSWKLNENYSPYEVENLHMDIRFVRPGDSFTVKNGEKILFSFPSILRAKGAGTYYNTGYPAKKFYKFTIRENPATKNWELEVEFLEDFELSAYGEIKGIITLDFSLDSTKLTEKTDNPVEISLPEQNYKIILPPLPSVISGVKKVADAQPAKGQVAWNITVGEDSPGVALNGLTVTDSFPSNHQVFKSATWLGKKDPLTGQDMTLPMTEASGGGSGMSTYSYTFPESGEVIRAPQTIRIVTGIRGEVYKDKNATTLRNNVSLSHKSEARLPKETNKRSTFALTTIPKISLNKSGTQVSGNRVRWKMDFNNNRAAAYQARVLDNLGKGLTLDESKGITIRYGGREATVLKPNNNHVNLAGRGFGDVNDVSYTYSKGTGPNGGDTLTLAFGTRFKEPYSIEFDTLVAEDFPLQGSGTDTSIGNKAQVVATYPTGDGVGSGISEELFNETPTISAPFKSIFLEIKGTGTDSRKALLNWRVKATTKENYEKLKLVINNGQFHEFNSLDLRYGEGASASNLFVDKASRDKLVNQTQTETIMASDGVTPIATLNLTYLPSTGAPAGGNVELTVIRNNAVPVEERFDIGLLSWNHDSKALYYMTRKDGNHYFGSNATLSLYTHKEDINPFKTVKSVADPQMMSQDMLRKTVQSFYDDEQKRAYFRFQITANASRMEDLKNFVLQDDLQNIFKYQKPNGLQVFYHYHGIGQ